MFKASASVASKIWTRFSITTINGTKMKFRIEQLLSNDRLDEFVDFKMNYFVKHEISHVVSGIPENEAAMQEYRQIMRKKLEKPSNQLLIITPDTNKETHAEILAISFTSLVTHIDLDNEISQAQTKEVKKYFKIFDDWGKFLPTSDILNKYGIDRYIAGGGAAVHPSYRGLGIYKPVFPLRRLICKEYDVRMTGAWMTSPASQKLAELDGWETISEIRCEELGRILGVTFKTSSTTFKYMIGKAP